MKNLFKDSACLLLLAVCSCLNLFIGGIESAVALIICVIIALIIMGMRYLDGEYK